MKWIGQHIWDFISRFRSDVYLEGTETGTIASGGNLGLDANNKIVKAASGSGDLTITNATDDRVVTSTGGTGLNAEANLTWDGEDLIAYSSTSSKPALKLQNSNTNDQGSLLQFIKSQNGAVDDELGHIQFVGKNVDGSTTHVWAEIIAYIQDPTAGAEEGKLVLNVASHDAEQQPGLSIYSGNVEDEVDVTIGNGAASLTTIAGDLDIDGDGITSAGALTLNPGGLFKTTASGVEIENDASSGAIALEVDNDDVDEIALKITADNTTASVLAVGASGLTTGKMIDTAHIDVGTTNNVNPGSLLYYAKTGITADGQTKSIDNFTSRCYDTATNHSGSTNKMVAGVFRSNFVNAQGTTTAEGINIDVSGAATNLGLSTTVTDGGTDIKCISSADTADYFSIATGANGATTISTVDGGAHAADLTFNVDGKTTFTCADEPGGGVVFHLDANADSDNIVDIDAGELDIDVTGRVYIDAVEAVVQNATSGMLTVQNTGANSTGGILNIINTHGGSDGDDSDMCGNIKFWTQNDGTPSLFTYGDISVQATDVSDDNETGTMRFFCATSGTQNAEAIAALGSNSAEQIDIHLAHGTGSTTTIAGDLDIDGDTITSAGVLKIIPADVSGLALHIDADADTDNEVQIDAGVLDINVTATATIDVATSLTITGKTLMNNRTLSVTPGSAAGEFDGDVVYTGTTTGMTTGALYVYAGTGNWVLANAAAVGTTKGLLAIALGDESDVDGMLLRGMVTTNGVSGTQDEGAELYMRASTGACTTVAPTGSGQFVRIVGYCMENSNSRIYFNPDNTYIEIA